MKKMCDKTMDISTERLRNLIDESEKTREAIASDVEMDTSTITKYYNGNRNLTVDAIKRFSKYFNVSADYLLGLSDAKTDNKDMQFVCDYLGLEAETAKTLISRKEYFPLSTRRMNGDISTLVWDFKNSFDEFLKVQSEFIRSEFFDLIVETIFFEKKLSKLLAETNQMSKNNTFSELELSNREFLGQAINDAYNRHRLNLFNAQDYLISYLKEISIIEELGEDRCGQLHTELLFNLGDNDESEDELNGNDN